jgi:hypothetical protein
MKVKYTTSNGIIVFTQKIALLVRYSTNRSSTPTLLTINIYFLISYFISKFIEFKPVHIYLSS